VLACQFSAEVGELDGLVLQGAVGKQQHGKFGAAFHFGSLEQLSE
jgi:hypothetical protein